MAAAVIVLLARNFRRVEIRWYDWVAVAYLVLIALYSTVPWLLGIRPAVQGRHRLGADLRHAR